MPRGSAASGESLPSAESLPGSRRMATLWLPASMTSRDRSCPLRDHRKTIRPARASPGGGFFVGGAHLEPSLADLRKPPWDHSMPRHNIDACSCCLVPSWEAVLRLRRDSTRRPARSSAQCIMLLCARRRRCAARCASWLGTPNYQERAMLNDHQRVPRGARSSFAMPISRRVQASCSRRTTRRWIRSTGRPSQSLGARSLRRL